MTERSFDPMDQIAKGDLISIVCVCSIYFLGPQYIIVSRHLRRQPVTPTGYEADDGNVWGTRTRESWAVSFIRLKDEDHLIN